MVPVKCASQKSRLLETGNEPEFFITHIAKFEPMPDGMVRIYVATQKGVNLRLEYTAVVTISALSEMGRTCLQMAGESHNLAVESDLRLN